MLCYFVNCLVLQAQQSNSTVQVLSKQKVLLDSFSIRSNQPITQLHSQVYVDYEKGNPKTFWKNLAFFTGSMALGSQLGQQLTLPQATENFSNSVQKSLLFPSIFLAFIPNIWHNRPRGVPDVNLRITHLNQQGIVLNTWEKTLTQEAKKGPTLLDIKLDTTLTSGKIEVSLENSSKRKAAYWASEVTPTRLDSIKPTTPTTYEPFVISRVSVRRDKAAVLPEQEVIAIKSPNIFIQHSSPFILKKSTPNLTKNRAIFRERNINQISTNSTTEYPPSDCVDGETDDGMGNCYCEEGTRAKSGGRGCENICGESQTYGANGCQCDNENEIINEEGKCVKGDKQKDCEDSGGSFDNENCSCPTDQVWDEQVNKCVIGGDVNVSDCRSGKVKNIFGECECEFGTEDDGMGGCSYPKTAQEECEEAGNMWNASTQTCMDSNSQQQDCENSGGNWNQFTQTCEQNCPEGYEKDGNGNCVEVSCPDGYKKDGNGNCVEVPCPAGYQRNVYGECVPQIPVVEPPLPPVTWGSRTYNDPKTQKNYYSEEKRCEGIQDMWNNAVTKEKEIMGYITQDGALITLPYQTSTAITARLSVETYNGTPFDISYNGSTYTVVATVHTHNQCTKDFTSGLNNTSQDDAVVYGIYIGIPNYVIGCGGVGITDSNGEVHSKTYGPLYETCWNIR